MLMKALVAKLSEENARLQQNLDLLIRWQKESETRSDASGALPANGQGHLFAVDLVAEADRTNRAEGTKASIEVTPQTPRKKARPPAKAAARRNAKTRPSSRWWRARSTTTAVG